MPQVQMSFEVDVEDVLNQIMAYYSNLRGSIHADAELVEDATGAHGRMWEVHLTPHRTEDDSEALEVALRFWPAVRCLKPASATVKLSEAWKIEWGRPGGRDDSVDIPTAIKYWAGHSYTRLVQVTGGPTFGDAHLFRNTGSPVEG